VGVTGLDGNTEARQQAELPFAPKTTGRQNKCRLLLRSCLRPEL